jgi:hypothetical protein
MSYHVCHMHTGWNVHADVEVSYNAPPLILPVDYSKYLESLTFNDLNDYSGT